MAREIDKDTLWSEIERKHALAQPRDREPDAVADAPSAPVQPPSEPPTTNAVDAMAPAAEADNGAQAPPAPVASEPVEPVTPRETDAAAIARLAAMGQLDYDRVRRQQAQALGVSVQTLDAEVRAARARQAPADDGMPFADPVPWPEPVDPAELLDEIAQTIRRFVVMDPEAGYTTALWNVQTHVADCFDTASILANTSAEPGSGKTTLASTVARICHRPLLASHASPSSIFRAVEK